MRSRFFVAVAAFILINLGLAGARFGAVPPQKFPEMTWTGWAVSDFLKSPKPNVLFLGSSLVLVPVAGTDADYLQKKLDGSKHHRSLYLEHAMKERTGRDMVTFNFALPGQMPSDAYLITDFLLRGEKRPDVIVYGVGPRDFMDNVLPSPSATDPFRSLSRFGDLTPRIGRVMPDLTERADYELGKAVYLYGMRGDLCAQTDKALSREIDRILPLPPGAQAKNIDERHFLIPEYRPCELTASEAFFRPSTAADRKLFVDNLEEYRKRYKTVKWDTFCSQMQFLADILNIARQRGTHVVLMAMPITDVNRGLIKDYAWDAYRHSIKALADVKGASFIDLGAGSQFNTNDFRDTVHLHSGGGQKMLDKLVQYLQNDGACRTALGLEAPSTRAVAGGNGTL